MPDARRGRPSAAAPAEPDVDLSVPRRRAAPRDVPWTTLAAISAGGVCGALARYAISANVPHRPGEFDWATFGVNVSGCLLIGVLMVLITEVRQAHRLVRPFLGVGVLGGFTTFSSAIVEVQRGVEAGAARTALLYLFGTLLCALAAVYAGVRLTRLLTRPRAGGARRGKEGP